MTKIGIMSLARLQNLPKNEKTRWKMFKKRKNPAQKNPREISGFNIPKLRSISLPTASVLLPKSRYVSITRIKKSPLTH